MVKTYPSIYLSNKIPLIPSSPILSSSSSSPVKKILINKFNITIDNSIQEDDITEEGNIVDKLKDKSFHNDFKLSKFLDNFNQNGIYDLGLDDISYSKLSETSFVKFNITYQFFYINKIVEILIIIPNTSNTNVKDLLLNYLKNKLILSNTNNRKSKIVILTPRPQASWFKRKLFNLKITNIKIDDNQYILLKVWKNYAQIVKQYLDEIL
ncbi:hypothetical protein DAPK24_053960 [Pichia kluyveri]|uniref:Uncharacterized protein n=1 Tax=Pichia kluyveri TaxID=36015 RepID=A0AAV5RBH4_PICKL|nr:hypothetical protein DAPK24_053960 [Pichia kluyveri]